MDLNWDDKRKVLTDYMGLPISRADALALRKQIAHHLKKSPADLAAIELEVVKEHHPYMDGKIEFNPGKFE